MCPTSHQVPASGTKLSTVCLPLSARTGVADHSLETVEIIVNLISATATSTGLKVACKLDKNVYEKGKVVSDEGLSGINLTMDDWHGEWNYVIVPVKQEN